jgi:hypothetical protein
MVAKMSELVLKKAERKRSFVKLGLTSPSGCGKTFSALKIARGLATSWDKVCIIDSEGSGDKYAGNPELGPYLVINLFEATGPDRFSPRRWIDAMEIAHAAGMEVVICDSATHEWQWCLAKKESIQPDVKKKSIYDWRTVSPEHDAFTACITQCPMHVIVCTRRKAEYVINESRKVEKVGMKSQMREGFEYELDLVIGLDTDHYATIEKDRSGIFASRVPFIPTENTGRQLLGWARAESQKPESERMSTPISIKDPKVLQRIHQILGDLKVLPEHWEGITAAVDGVAAGDVRARLEEMAGDVMGLSQEASSI